MHECGNMSRFASRECTPATFWQGTRKFTRVHAEVYKRLALPAIPAAVRSLLAVIGRGSHGHTWLLKWDAGDLCGNWSVTMPRGRGAQRQDEKVFEMAR
jgi:hypothetical protein